ncbi:MAG: hypothetical protein AMJ43_07850 [Coxiella sp. DG_40]|nr:MAG: hypothetical protein AMJ43_07850 [Coxiella sp. DG_40]
MKEQKRNEIREIWKILKISIQYLNLGGEKTIKVDCHNYNAIEFDEEITESMGKFLRYYYPFVGRDRGRHSFYYSNETIGGVMQEFELCLNNKESLDFKENLFSNWFKWCDDE